MPALEPSPEHGPGSHSVALYTYLDLQVAMKLAGGKEALSAGKAAPQFLHLDFSPYYNPNAFSPITHRECLW